MVQKLGEWGLKKKFNIDKLSKIGGVYFKGRGVKEGLQRGSVLKSTLVGMGKGKVTKYQFERALKQHGVIGSQLSKRNKILDLAYGDKKTGLTKEQKERNLSFTMKRDESGIDKKRGRQTVSAAASSVAGVKTSVGANLSVEENIGIKKVTVGFVKNLNNKTLSNNQIDKPIGGVKPLGL